MSKFIRVNVVRKVVVNDNPKIIPLHGETLLNTEHIAGIFNDTSSKEGEIAILLHNGEVLYADNSFDSISEQIYVQ